MKQNIHHPVSARQSRDGLYYLNYPRGWIIIALLLFTATAFAQEQTPPKEFVLDASVSYEGLFVEPIYNSFIDCGFNTMMQRATDSSKPLLENFNLHAFNMADSSDWIYYYSSAYYSKWEAEEDQPRWDKVGVKHRDTLGNLIGKPATYLGTQCWSSNGLTSARDSLIYGPSYHQEKSYRRWLYMSPEERYDLRYTPRFRMALSKHPSVPGTQDVCRLYVIVKYRRIVDNEPDSTDSTYVLKEPITLKVSDFPSNGEFDYFYFSDNIDERWYKYPSIIRDPEKAEAMLPAVQGIFRDDKWGGTGVQFCIDWLRSDTLCTLYIDNIEVYDNDGWNHYLSNPVLRANDIKDYALYFKNTGWNNIKYWIGGHEPSSIDEYVPIRVVDSLIQSDPVNAPPLMNTIWAHWTLDLNGESQLERYYNMTQPDKLLVEFHPIQAGYDVTPPFAFEVLRRILQESYSLTQEKKFYYHVQSYGQWKNDDWYVLRRPNVPEYKTTIMLALSHGADGLVQASYDSQPWIPGSYYYGVLGLIGLAPDYEPTDLWYELKNNLIPRLNGKLGQTLMGLNYTGDYLYLGRYLQNLCCGFLNSGPIITKRYLTLTEYSGENTPPPVHFHAGFFSRPNHLYDNYFMLDNLITTNAKTVTATLEPPIAGFANYRFRNIEGLFDTTFNENGIVKLLTHPAGEGYLYQVAPVILYGGKLIFNETISSEKTLVDDLIIKNGKTLTINATYNADRSITITEGGRLVTTLGGTVKFYNDQNLIIDGTATISGTPQHKLVLDFLNPAERNGIIIKPGGSLTIVNCEIRNAGTGIFSELNANYLSVQNVDFINCADYSISIAGRNAGMNPTPPPQITGCTMLNSNYGIAISNLPGMLIFNNDITNTACGIYLSNVTDAQIIGNTIISNREEYPGLWIFSSGGAIRSNYITGHTNGVHFANSAMVLGSNYITENKFHGLYIGDGSLPYMRQGQWVGIPPNMYATSGYNKIFQNGGYEGEGDDNDGSEIYFVNSNARMDKGCNSIYDDREPSPPLLNTELLMNCPEWSPIEVNAQINYWGN